MDTNKISEMFNSAAKKYDEQRRFFIPCFDEFYESGINFLSKAGYSFKKVLDLGAGTGLLTSYMYASWPDAHYTLVDVSDQMLDIAHIRFKGTDNVEFLVSDYSASLPQISCDLVSSALSIHHLENSVKAELYRSIYNMLDEGGCLLNLDQFNASTEQMNGLYDTQWYDFIKQSGITPEHGSSWKERRELDRENTVHETIGMLRAAGFSSAECIYSHMKFAVIVAIR